MPTSFKGGIPYTDSSAPKSYFAALHCITKKPKPPNKNPTTMKNTENGVFICWVGNTAVLKQLLFKIKRYKLTFCILLLEDVQEDHTSTFPGNLNGQVNITNCC